MGKQLEKEKAEHSRYQAIAKARADEAAAAGGMVSASSEILALADGNKEVTFLADGTETKGMVSGKRTAVTVDGAAATRKELAAGMSCDFTYEAGDEIEFKTASCTSQ